MATMANKRLTFGTCVIVATMSFMYMIAGYTGYSYMDDNGGNDDVMNGHGT